jgi:PIN domain nuclease of toxin-antitoxin system
VGGESVIVLDTHIWIWWADQAQELGRRHRDLIDQNAPAGLGVSVFSCWEVAKLVEKGRLKLSKPVDQWVGAALELPDVVLLPLTPEIAIESAHLPPRIHADPADQLIVATARVLKVPLLTADKRLIDYPHVTTL